MATREYLHKLYSTEKPPFEAARARAKEKGYTIYITGEAGHWEVLDYAPRLSPYEKSYQVTRAGRVRNWKAPGHLRASYWK